MNPKFVRTAMAIADHFKQAEAARGEPYPDNFANKMLDNAVTPTHVSIPLSLLRQLAAAQLRAFPILGGRPGSVTIPWEVIAPFEHQAQRNHSQSLERLAERGGLGYQEALAVLRCQKFEEVTERGAEAVLALEILVAERLK